MKRVVLLVSISMCILIGCSSDEESSLNTNIERNPPAINNTVFADANLIQEAQDLHSRLQTLTSQGIAFGQQAPFGTGNNFPVPNRLEEDFFEVAGDHPAIVGFDIELISIPLDVDAFIDRFIQAVIEAHENGSIITISWHAVNPSSINAGGPGEDPNVIPRLLEGGDLRNLFLRNLEYASRLFNSLIDTQGNPIPVLFRPWHEMNGDFFWWGEGSRTTEEYIQLWRDTVRILSEDFNVNNLLYVYAPNWVADASEYLRNYPGDAFVDVLGVDVYDFRNGNFLSSIANNLRIIENIATEKNKLFALTETGLENVTQNDWWTENLFRAIRSSNISYTMIWRNDSTTFFHAPFVGHPSEDNFRAFLNEEVMLLSSEID